MAAESNPFSENSADSNLFTSKNTFSTMYSGKEWDFDEVTKPESIPTTPSIDQSKPTAPTDEGQDYIPKLLQSSNWDANLSMEDIKATAQALATNNALKFPVVTPKPVPFSDAFKSREWSLAELIPQDIQFTPEMLDKTHVPPKSPQPKSKTVQNFFNSRDWLASELLGTHKDISLSPDIFDVDNDSPIVSQDVQNDKTPTETNWESMFLDQIKAVHPTPTLAPTPPTVEIPVSEISEKPPTKKRKRKKRTKVVPEHKEYVTVSEVDVLLGRGGKSNHHAGNKRYREEVENFRPLYATLTTDQEKTEMSQILVDTIEKTGGRFLEEDKIKDEQSGKTTSLGWYVVPNIVARRKASQALREDNDPAKRKAKRARFLAKKNAMH